MARRPTLWNGVVLAPLRPATPRRRGGMQRQRGVRRDGGALWRGGRERGRCGASIAGLRALYGHHGDAC
jgi:hypothetical protein